MAKIENVNYPFGHFDGQLISRERPELWPNRTAMRQLDDRSNEPQGGSGPTGHVLNFFDLAKGFQNGLP